MGGTFGLSPPFRLIRERVCAGIRSRSQQAVVEERNGLLEDQRKGFATFATLANVQWESKLRYLRQSGQCGEFLLRWSRPTVSEASYRY
jgi:hypothetical protein